MKVLSPLAKAGIKMSNLFFRRVKERAAHGIGTRMTDEIRADAREQAAIKEENTKMLERVLDFSERQVKDVTVPRPGSHGTGDGHASRRHSSHR